MTAKAELLNFLKGALPLAQGEVGTSSWYALQMDSRHFGIFDTFPSEIELQSHVAGAIAKALFAKAPELLEDAPHIEKVKILASK